jgi:hypothetical protein
MKHKSLHNYFYLTKNIKKVIVIKIESIVFERNNVH